MNWSGDSPHVHVMGQKEKQGWLRNRPLLRFIEPTSPGWVRRCKTHYKFSRSPSFCVQEKGADVLQPWAWPWVQKTLEATQHPSSSCGPSLASSSCPHPWKLLFDLLDWPFPWRIWVSLNSIWQTLGMLKLTGDYFRHWETYFLGPGICQSNVRCGQHRLISCGMWPCGWVHLPHTSELHRRANPLLTATAWEREETQIPLPC